MTDTTPNIEAPQSIDPLSIKAIEDIMMSMTDSLTEFDTAPAFFIGSKGFRQFRKYYGKKNLVPWWVNRRIKQIRKSLKKYRTMP